MHAVYWRQAKQQYIHPSCKSYLACLNYIFIISLYFLSSLFAVCSVMPVVTHVEKINVKWGEQLRPTYPFKNALPVNKHARAQTATLSHTMVLLKRACYSTLFSTGGVSCVLPAEGTCHQDPAGCTPVAEWLVGSLFRETTSWSPVAGSYVTLALHSPAEWYQKLSLNKVFSVSGKCILTRVIPWFLGHYVPWTSRGLTSPPFVYPRVFFQSLSVCHVPAFGSKRNTDPNNLFLLPLLT